MQILSTLVRTSHVNKTKHLRKPAEQLACLKGLTKLEEMLIARVMPLMQVRHTRGGQTCYKEHIANLPQDIRPLAIHSPQLPENVDIVLIRKESVDM